MKKTITLCFLLLGLCLTFGQNLKRIPQRVNDLKMRGTTFQNFAVLQTSETTNKEYIKAVNNATIVAPNNQLVKQIANEKPAAIKITVPYLNGMVNIELYRVEIATSDFYIATDKSSDIHYTLGAYYRGIIQNDNNSVVAFNFFNDGTMSGIFSNDAYGNVSVVKLLFENNKNDYVVYSDRDIYGTSLENYCNTLDTSSPEDLNDSTQRTATESTKCITVYHEVDYNLFVLNGQNTTTAGNWLTGAFNNAETLYDNDGINVTMRSSFIWTSQDPYQNSGTSSSAYLSNFMTTRTYFDGDVAQLVSIDPGSMGGLAAGINTLCTSANYNYCDVNFSYSTVPTYSWTVMMLTHELGHNLGSQHTHGCYWNGNNTAIDGCAPTASSEFQEGTCAIGPIPAAGGTIMSYCHMNVVGVNFNLGFGEQPLERIIERTEAKTCLSTDCTDVCINALTGTLTLNNVTQTSASVKWNVVNEDNNYTWQYLLNPTVGTQTYQYIDHDSNEITFDNLTPNTYYRLRVRQLCSSGTTFSYKEYYFATNGDFCNGAIFSDTGGASANYTNNVNFVRTIYPDNAGQKAKVTFSEFSLGTGDYLKIYNGTSTSSPALTGASGLTGSTLPNSYQSTDDSGALTFEFYSDSSNVSTGWLATFECEELGIGSSNNYLDYTYSPNPVKDILTITAKNNIKNVEIYAIDGKKVYSKININANEAKINMQGYTTGTYVVSLNLDGKVVSFKVVKK